MPTRRKLGICLFLILFLTSAACLVYYLILLPAKTPLLAAVAVEYRWPLPPNGWAREDLDSLTNALGSQTVSIREVPFSGASNVQKLGEQIELAGRRIARQGTVLVYLSAHGAVDGEGQPCLVLPQADPVDSGTWLPLSPLLEQLKSIQQRSGCRHLLILDCNRQQENLSLGQLENRFAESVGEAVAKVNAPGLVVLNSTSRDQTGWASAQLQGSVFGAYLRLGMAGDADRDQDGSVSLRELHGYLQQHVDTWARDHRHARQTPTLYPANAADFPVAWSLNPRALRRLKQDLEQPTAKRFPSGERLARLWDLHDRIMAVQPAQVAPVVWPQIEHQLVWLEEAALAGEAYRTTFERLGQSLDDRLKSILAAIRPPDSSRAEAASPARLAAVLSGDQTFLAQEFGVPSPTVAEYLGLTAPASEGVGGAPFLGFRNQLHPGEERSKVDYGDQVIALHELAERLSVPRPSEKHAADLRAHRLIRPQLEDADQGRRLIEDRLITGSRATLGLAAQLADGDTGGLTPPRSPHATLGLAAQLADGDTGGLTPPRSPHATLDLAAQLADVQRRYDASASMEETLARGYQVRDRVWSEVPYLILWSRCRSQVGSGETPVGNEPDEESPRATKDELRSLVDRAAQLDAALQQVERRPSPAASAREQLPAIDALTAEIEAALAQLHTRLLEDAKRLSLAGPATSEMLCELAGVLATPFVPGQLRAELRDRYGTVAEEVDRVADGGASKSEARELAGSESPASPTGAPSDGTGESRTEVDRLVYLVTAMLGTGNVGPSSAGAPDPRAVGVALRETLQTAAQAVRASAPVKAGQTDEPGQDGSELPDGWFEDQELDRRLRRLATILPPLPDDPFRRIWHRSLQDLLLWHGQRAVDDFWGPTGPEREPLFVQAAEAYLAAARRIAQPDPEIARRIEQLAGLLERRRQAARAAFVVTSTDFLLLADDADLTAQIGVQCTPAGRDLPSGMAAVFLGDEQGPLPATVSPLDIDSSGSDDRPALGPVAVPVRSGDLKTRGPTFQAAVMFRGHRFATPWMVRELGGTRVDVTRHKYGPSRVTLTGPGRKQASIVFVLDCSHSMIDRVDLEAPSVSGQDSRPAKLNVAADALRTMLERFGERGDMRIGVRFFGHRVGWRTDQAETLARQEAYPDDISPTLRPYEDVELFLPLGRFDSVIAGNVSRRLRELRPWGESPIYLALRQALLDFGPEDEQSEKYVVVITDGRNYQFNPPPESAPTLGEIEQAYASRGIHVEIVGFAIPADEQATAFREFGELSTRTGGSFSVATNASSLIRDLQRRMVKTEFRVVQGDRVLGRAEVGGTIVVPSTGETQVQVEDLRATAALEGGENLQLAVNRDGERIASLPYEEGRPVFAPLIAPATLQPTGYRAGLHRPLRDAQAVVFPVSFQTGEAGIPARLAHVWIEIAPIAAGQTAAAEAYLFFDANYEPETPVPVIHCRCPDWPAEADRAEVRVWCSPKAVPDAEVVPFETVANRVPPTGAGFPLTRLAGVAYQVLAVDSPSSPGPRRIRVVQRHEAGISVHAIKLDLAPPPNRRVHQFDANLGVVLHTFEYDPSDAPADTAIALRFQTRDELNDAAWRLDRPVIVNVAKHTDVVSPPQVLSPVTRTE